MAAVNWDGTEKVIDQRCHTVNLTNDFIQKSYVVWEQWYPQPPKKAECYILKIFNLLLQNSCCGTNIYWKQGISRWSQQLAPSNSLKIQV